MPLSGALPKSEREACMGDWRARSQAASFHLRIVLASAICDTHGSQGSAAKSASGGGTL
jgi:hypothetical protein